MENYKLEITDKRFKDELLEKKIKKLGKVDKVVLVGPLLLKMESKKSLIELGIPEQDIILGCLINYSLLIIFFILL